MHDQPQLTCERRAVVGQTLQAVIRIADEPGQTGDANTRNQDGTLNSPSNPAAPGSTVTFFKLSRKASRRVIAPTSEECSSISISR